MFPSQGVIAGVFAPQHPLTRSRTQPPRPAAPASTKRNPFPAWSAVETTKEKYNAASQKAQATTGKIEMYSFKYYVACTFGGLLACVSTWPVLDV